MTKLDALKELAEKVDQAFLPKPSYLADCRFPNGLWQTAKLHGHQDKVWGAYNGSLDAAKALHEAVLPGWEYNASMGFAHVFPPHDKGDQEVFTGEVCANSARAWLLAIIKALIAQETDR